MEELDKDIINDLNKIGNRIIGFIKQLMIRGNKNATRETIDTLRQAVEIDINSVFSLDIFGSIVFRYINDGRPPRSKLPPSGALINSGWMKARGIPESAEFVIRRAIAKKGIKPYPVIDLTVTQIQKNLIGKASDQVLNVIADRLTDALGKNFDFPVIQL